MSISANHGSIMDEETCKMVGLYLATSYETMASQVIMVIIFGKISYTILRRLYMPRLLSDMLVSTVPTFRYIKPIIYVCSLILYRKYA